MILSGRFFKISKIDARLFFYSVDSYPPLAAATKSSSHRVGPSKPPHPEYGANFFGGRVIKIIGVDGRRFHTLLIASFLLLLLLLFLPSSLPYLENLYM